MRLLLDEMLGPKLAEQLRSHGFDVVAAVERMDIRALADDVVLGVATSEERVLVTTNVGDFAALARRLTTEGQSHAGIVLVTTAAFPQNRAFIGRLVQALVLARTADHLPLVNEVRYLRAPSSG